MSDTASLVDSLRHRPVATTAAQMREAADLIDSLTHERDAIAKERDELRKDAERYRYWRQHQYQGLLDVDEYCDANSPQAIHFDRITDAAMAALTPKDAEGRKGT